MYPPLPRSEIELPGGRILSYAEFGRPLGTPVFLFHGTPGSRLIGRLGHNAAADRDLRLIVPDRPGMGRSTFQGGRTILNWVDDITVLTASLGIEKFAIAGIHGGGPHALACALNMPERLLGVAIVSSLAPVRSATTRGMSRLNKLQFRAARSVSPLARLEWAGINIVGQRYPEQLIRKSMAGMPPADEAVFERDEVRDTLVADFNEATTKGGHGVSHELGLMAKPWGFRVEEVTTPVHLWQGELDKSAPVAMGRYLAKALPAAQATFLPEAGHYWYVDHLDQVFGAIVPRPGAPTTLL